MSDAHPTYYDVLGVPPDATPAEIKQAWRESADRFEPGSGGSHFALFNKAAEVLLDPERRTAYDADLGLGGSPAATAGTTTPQSVTDADDPRPPADEALVVPTTINLERGSSSTARSGPSVRWWVGLGLLAVVAAVCVAAGAWLWSSAERAQEYERALDQAPAAAESAAKAVLSYDHESLEADRDAAAKFLTGEYRAEYVETFDQTVLENAPDLEAEVKASVLASAAVSVPAGEENPDQVSVLVFVDQTTTSTATEGQPRTALNRVRMEMRQVDGSWLVADITSY